MLNTILLESATTKTGSDFLDLLIAGVVLMFIFSTITEKLTELIRMYPVQFRMVGGMLCVALYYFILKGAFSQPSLNWTVCTMLFLFTTVIALLIFANTNNSEKSTHKTRKFLNNNLGLFKNIKKDRETSIQDKVREVSALSFTVGLVVSFLFNVSLFNLFDAPHQIGFRLAPIFTEKPPYGFNPEFFVFSFTTALGCILTGFFLSFGARFFHDVLDTLLQVKNLKRKANEAADGDFSTIAEFDTYMATQEKPLFESFLTKQLSQQGVFYESNYDKKTVKAFISNPAAVIPDKLFYKNSLGKIVAVTVEKVNSPEIKTLGQTIFPSIEIANELPYENKLRGTLCYFVKLLNSPQVLILTCYHVVWSNHDWNHFTPINRENIVHPFGGKSIGTIHKAIKNSCMDAALVIPKEITPVNQIDGIGLIVGDRPLNSGDINTTVKMRGSISGTRVGYIAEMNKKVDIKYPDGTWKELTNLIYIRTNDGKPFSVGGDSGSLLVDGFGYAIGMIVAGDEHEISLAIPFSIIKSQMNVEIYKA